MKRTFFAFFLVLICMTGTLYAQNKYSDSENYQKAREYFYQEDFDSVILLLEKEIKEHPDNAYAYALKAESELAIEQTEEAIKSLQLAKQYLSPTDTILPYRIYTLLGDSYSYQEDYTKSIENYSLAISIDSTGFDAYSGRAVAYLFSVEYELAQKDFTKALSINGDDPYTLVPAALIEEKIGSMEKALSYLTHAFEESPSDVFILLRKAKVEISLEKYHEAAIDIVHYLSVEYNEYAHEFLCILAEDSFSDVLALLEEKLSIADSQESEMWEYYIGDIYKQTEQYSQALEHYNKLNRVFPALLDRKVDCYYGLRKWSAALETIELLLKDYPENEEFLESKIEISLYNGQIEQALACCEKGLTINPENIQIYTCKAWGNVCLGKLEAAIEDYTKCIGLIPNYGPLYAERGKAYLKQGNKELAEADFKKSIELSTIADRYSRKHIALYYLGYEKEAKDWIKKTLDENPKDPNCYISAANLYSVLGESDIAISYLQKAFELGYFDIVGLEYESMFDNIRSDKRYIELIEKYKTE